MKHLAPVLLLLSLATGARAQDAFPLSSAQIVNAQDVSAWPQTATMTRVTFNGYETSVQFTKQYGPDRWPDVVPAGWDGPLQYTLWLFLKQGDHWVGSGFIQFWYGRQGSGSAADPDVPSVFDKHWYYGTAWRPMDQHGPIRPGESIGFMVTSGNARFATGPMGPMERSNVVVVPAADVADYTFASTPPPPVVVPPPVVIPPPPPVVVVPPSPPVTPGLDYTEQLRQIVAAQQAELALAQDTNAQVRQLNKSFTETLGAAMAFIGKYILPAIAAFVAGRML